MGGPGFKLRNSGSETCDLNGTIALPLLWGQGLGFKSHLCHRHTYTYREPGEALPKLSLPRFVGWLGRDTEIVPNLPDILF